jgi:Transposase DDE domain
MRQHARLTRRIVGLLSARLPDLQLQDVPDGRDPRWVSWPMVTVLRALITCLAASCTGLRQAEELTEQMSLAMRRKLGIRGRIPDTTMRTIASGLDPDDIRQRMHQQIRAAARRKALLPDQLPFNVAMLDGKSTALPSCDDHFAQRQSNDSRLIGLLRTMSCSLVTTAAQPCIDAISIPAGTNEMGHFRCCVDQLLAAYGSIDLFRMVAADAGNCCEANARHVRDVGLHYLFGLKDNQPTLATEATRLLGRLEQAAASSDDRKGNSRRVVRRLFIAEQMAGFEWQHLRTVLRVQSLTYAHGKLVATEDRYFVSSLPASRLTRVQWLRIVRLMWGVENAVHCTLDKTMREDEHPWIKADPKAALVIALLRRIAYNLLALFRSVTLRSEHSRSTPWKQVMRWVELALLTATHDDVAGLRNRYAPAAATS